MNASQRFLGFNFLTVSPDHAVNLLIERCVNRHGSKVYFINANSVVIANSNAPFSTALQSADLILADGSGVLWGSKLHRRPLEHNLNGTDLVPRLCQAAAKKGLRVYFLGGKPGIAEKASSKLLQRCPGLTIAGVQDGYYAPETEQQILENIRRAEPHLLLVAKGSPLQEMWIDQHQRDLPGVTCLAVGGLFDFLAEAVVRAPVWVRRIGMEWVWRMLMEPKRLWRRYLVGNLVYLGILLRALRNPAAEPANSHAGA